MADFPNIKPDGNATWGIRASTSEFRSVLSGSTQYRALTGDRWEGVLSFSNRSESVQRSLRGFITALRGRQNTFAINPPNLDQQGTLNGTPTVDGGGQTGTSLNTTGWTANQTNLMEPGDYFEVNGELKMATETISSDGAGDATLVFQPPLRDTPTSGQSIEVTDPRCTVRLENDDQAKFQVSANYIHTLQISVREDVT